jgi:hypothetical protein
MLQTAKNKSDRLFRNLLWQKRTTGQAGHHLHRTRRITG